MKALPFLALIAFLLVTSLQAADAPVPGAIVPDELTRDVIDLGAPSAELIPVPSHVDIVTVQRASDGAGLDIRIAPGPVAYPGIVFRLDHSSPDLSAFGYVEARVVNTSDRVVTISLRADSAAAPAQNIEKGTATGVAYLKPGAAGVARVYFAFPKKGSAPLDPRRLTQLFLFIGKNTEHARGFRLESITAGGRPGDLPPPRS